MAFRFRRDEKFRDRIEGIVADLPDRNAIRLSVIDLSRVPSDYAGVNDEQPIYSASLSQLDVAAVVCAEVASGRLSLDQFITIKPHNAVDQKSEIPSDTRGLLKAGDEVSLCYLLDFMLTGSSNTSANELIDLVGRKRIDQFIASHGWEGNEVTRKFLPRVVEDPAYRNVPATMQTSKHFSELLYLLQVAGLPHAGMILALLAGQRDHSKIQRGLPPNAVFAHKTGWFESTAFPQLNSQGDCGIVEHGSRRYVVSCIVNLPIKEGEELLCEIGRRLHAVI